MYSRYDRPREPVKLPENYGGCAFSERSDRPSEPPRRIDIAKPTPPPEVPEAALALPRPVFLPAGKEAEEHTEPPKADLRLQKEEPPACEEGATGRSILSGLGFPFSHGIGFDELLLIGMTVLLSGSEQAPDIHLWLLLLLFMG